MIQILIGCEESQSICNAFREEGLEAYSCDLLPCSGNHPEWHLQMDVFDAIKLKNWKCAIFHPPCTFLATSGARWYYHPDDKDLPFDKRRPHPKYPNRRKDQSDAVDFFIKLAMVDIPHIAIENPVGIMSTKFRKPDCSVNPWMFGDSFQKTTHFWLKNLPILNPTNIVDKGEFHITKSGKKLPKWYVEAMNNAKNDNERRTLRSKTFPGLAKAIANQWGNYLKNLYE